MSAIIFKDLIAYEEETGAEILLQGLSGKIIKRFNTEDDDFYEGYVLLDKPIMGKSIIRKWVDVPMEGREEIALYDLISEVEEW